MDLELTTCYPNLNKLLICIHDSGLTGINDSLEKAGKSLLKTFEDGFSRLQERFRSAFLYFSRTMGIEIESDFLGERSCGKFFNLGGIPVLP
jgi:hypothetical protein